MKATIRTEGFKEFEKTLLGMKAATAKNTVRRAMAKALEPVAEAAKAAVPRTAGAGTYGTHLGDTINVSRHLTRAQKKAARAWESPTRTEVYVGSASWGHLVEFGTGPRFHKKTGKFVGAAPAQPFIRPAWDANTGRVLEILSEQMSIEIAKTLARAAKRAAKGK